MTSITMDMDSMTVKELKQELKSRGLKTSGKKADLKERLGEALLSEQTIAESTEALTNDDTTIADFEEYINAEHKRLKNNEKQEKEKENENMNEVDIDDIINKNNETMVEDEEKHQELLTDFDLTTPQQPPQQTQEIVSDFAPITTSVSLDPNALNNKDKVQDRMNRFGTLPISAMDDKDKIESRKRRFAAMDNGGINNDESVQPSKKQKVDVEAERKKIFERAQKFGTALPKNFKLTKEQNAVIHADKIERAKRFGTEHLLPAEIYKAEQDSKKQERMKRFNTNENGKIIGADFEEEKPPKNIIKADDEPNGSTKLMERKLRFGTLTETDKQKQREQRFGGGKTDKNALKADITLDEMQMNNKKNVKKKFTPRQQRSNERIQRFRQYKKNKNNFNNNNNQFQRRGRGGFRGRGNNGNRGRGGRFRGGYNNRNFNKFNNNFKNNQQGGYRNNNNGNYNGNGNNNGNNFNRRGRGNFNGNFNNNQNNNNNNQRQRQQTTPVKFSAEDLQKIEERKLRFTALTDF